LTGNSLVLALGQNATCTINNNDTAPRLTLQKTVINDNGGVNVDTDFTLTATGPTTISGVEGAAAITNAAVNAGTYTLTESGAAVANYAQGVWSCTAGTLTGNSLVLSLGQTATCTITNNDKAPTLSITKSSLGGGGSFGFSTSNSGSGSTSSTLDTAISNPISLATPITLTSANVATTVTETAPPGWSLASASCTDANAANTGNTGSFGTLSGTALTIPAANVKVGAAFLCTFVNGMPGLSVTKTGTLNDGGDGVANAGDTISYSFTIANTGTVTLTNVSASDPGATISGGPIAALAPSASDSTTIAGIHTLTQAEIDAGGYANTVTITANPPTGPVVTANDTETVTLFSAPSFTVVKVQSAGPNPVAALPATLTYTITVDNTGNRTLTAPAISDSLMQGGNSLTLATGPTLTAGDTDSDNALDTTESWIYTATYAVTQANLDDGGNLVNTATFDSAETAPVASPAVTTPVSQLPGLTIVKTADTAGPVAINDVITYTYTVANTGNVTIAGVTVSDVHNGHGSPPVPGGEAILNDQAPLGDSTDAAVNGSWDALAPGDSVTFASTYTVTQTDVDLLQ
jgi:uncharacterized repeat protein (TIGR01451 family)